MLDWLGSPWIWLGLAVVLLISLFRRRGKRAPATTASGSVAEPPELDHPDPAPDPVRLPIEDSLDLHAFSPRDVLDVTAAYLREAAEAGFTEVRLIHGRGTGFQRERVRRFLSSHPLVARYRDAPPERGGWGATLVWLADADEGLPEGPPRAPITVEAERRFCNHDQVGETLIQTGRSKMSTFVSDLEPQQLWMHFDKILTIPRGSKNEAEIAGYVMTVAERRGLPFEHDAAGNIVVRKPAAAGFEDVPVTILQCHLDMVNEKNEDVEHDFTKDPIRPVRDGGYLKADGTTLGSDNGIGVAAALALMESASVRCGPLEFLFTVDEETGLTGAAGLEPNLLRGRRLINLDTEEEGALYVGCAGGAGVNITLELGGPEPAAGETALKVRLTGLRGGHSGVDIHLQRGNAIKLLARALDAGRAKTAYRLVSFNGGNMHNAIPREASAVVVLEPFLEEPFKRAVEAEFARIQAEFRSADPDLAGSIETAPAQSQALSAESTDTVVRLLRGLPHGVLGMSYDIPDLVETSSNLATVRSEGNRLKVHVSNRSSVGSALAALQSRVGAIGELAGAKVDYVEGYPGWKPDLSSVTLKAARKVFREHFGKEPAVKAIHAGLECGLIGEKYPGMDMVSLGPQIEFPHSPDERVRIESVAEFYTLLSATLEELAK